MDNVVRLYNDTTITSTHVAVIITPTNDFHCFFFTQKNPSGPLFFLLFLLWSSEYNPSYLCFLFFYCCGFLSFSSLCGPLDKSAAAEFATRQEVLKQNQDLVYRDALDIDSHMYTNFNRPFGIQYHPVSITGLFKINGSGSCTFWVTSFCLVAEKGTQFIVVMLLVIIATSCYYFNFLAMKAQFIPESLAFLTFFHIE